MTFIAGEIENPKRNVPLALAFGVLGVTNLYLLANISYLCVLPFWGDANSTEVLGKGIQYATQDRWVYSGAYCDVGCRWRYIDGRNDYDFHFWL